MATAAGAGTWPLPVPGMPTGAPLECLSDTLFRRTVGSSNGGGAGGQGGQGGQTTAAQVFHDDLARGMNIASAGVDAIRHSKALPLAIDVATIAATIALGSALIAGTAFGAIASHRRAQKLPEGTFQMLSNGAHAIAGIVTVAGKGLETLRQKAPLR